jgi:hypothetical protein
MDMVILVVVLEVIFVVVGVLAFALGNMIDI